MNAVLSEGLQNALSNSERKTASARKAMGVRKNEANSDSIRQMISRWENDMIVALYADRLIIC